MLQNTGPAQGFNAATDMMTGWARNWSAMAAEMSDHAKRVFEDGAATLEAMMESKDLTKAAELQQAYLTRCYDANMKQASKLSNMYAGITRQATEELGKVAQRIDN